MKLFSVCESVSHFQRIIFESVDHRAAERKTSRGRLGRFLAILQIHIPSLEISDSFSAQKKPLRRLSKAFFKFGALFVWPL